MPYIEKLSCKFILLFCCLFLFLGCAPFGPALKESPVSSLVGQTVYNRVSLRVLKKKAIWYTNYYHTGTLITVGTECTINSISRGTIKFTAQGKEYKLKDWLIDEDPSNLDQSFAKYFVKDKKEIGLDNVNPEFYDNVISGYDEIGMSKEEILMALGYPAYLGIRDPTTLYTREYILSQNDWYYMKSRFNRVLLIFKAGKLVRIMD
jgi:hypothetical protein